MWCIPNRYTWAPSLVYCLGERVARRLSGCNGDASVVWGRSPGPEWEPPPEEEEEEEGEKEREKRRRRVWGRSSGPASEPPLEEEEGEEEGMESLLRASIGTASSGGRGEGGRRGDAGVQCWRDGLWLEKVQGLLEGSEVGDV